MAKRSDDQRKAMFASMANPSSRKKSRRLKRPKATKSVSSSVRRLPRLKPILKSKLPVGWRASKVSLGKDIGGDGIYFPNKKGYYIDIGKYGWQSGYQVSLEGIEDEKGKPIQFSDKLFSEGRFIVRGIHNKHARNPSEANRIALQFMRDVNKGGYAETVKKKRFKKAVEKIDREKIRKEVEDMTSSDLNQMIEIGVARNIGGLNDTMLDDSREDKVDYLFEMDDDTLEQIYLRFID